MAFIDGADYRFFIDRHIQRAPHPYVIQRFTRNVIGQITHTKAWLAAQFEIGIRFNLKNQLGGFNIRRFQMVGMAVNRIIVSLVWLRKIKGPVPTGFWLISGALPFSSNCAAYSAERIDAKGTARLCRKGALASFSVNRTAIRSAPSASIFSTSRASPVPCQ